MVAFFKAPKIDFKSKISQLKALVEEKSHDLRDNFLIAREKSKDLVKTNYELGLDHWQRGNLYDATLRFKMTLFLRPDHLLAHYQLGRCYLAKNKHEQAKKEFNAALQLQPDFPESLYFLSTLGELPPPATIPLTIIEDYFDGLASSYTSDMVEQQHYTGHNVIADTLLPLISDSEKNFQILDLGCGTGLCGKIIKEAKSSCILTGIDVSRKMLSEAKSLKTGDIPVYDYLKHTNIVEYVATTEKKYHALVAGLSFNYLGDLTEALTHAKGILHPGAPLILTVQHSDVDNVAFTPDMKSFCYAASYMTRTAESAGFSTIAIKDQLLYDHCVGLLCVFNA